MSEGYSLAGYGCGPQVLPIRVIIPFFIMYNTLIHKGNFQIFRRMPNMPALNIHFLRLQAGIDTAKEVEFAAVQV